MPSLTQSEIIKRAEKIREYHKLAPTGAERLHINRGRQLMYELLKDIFGDPCTVPGKPFKGDWEMLFTQCGTEAILQALQLQQQTVQQKVVDEQQRKIELAILRLAYQTTAQLKAMLLDTAAENLARKQPGEISVEGLVRRLENELSKGPTPPEGQPPFTWQTTFEQQGTAGLRAWVAYELNVAEYQLSSLPAEDKPEKINFEVRILQNKTAYLKQVLNLLPE
ncbi:MAG: hypothetical protein AB1489_25985 [Acidobacteriota bacterium]